jgi:hypothetical protein
MRRKRQRVLLAVINGVKVVFKESRSVVSLLLDTGEDLINRSRATAPRAEKSELDQSIRDSRLKILALKYAIGKEMIRLQWYGFVRNMRV